MTHRQELTRDHWPMTHAPVVLRTFTRTDVVSVAPWFRDAETRRYLGGPDWPTTMLELGERAVGEEFRGAIQTGAHRYLAELDDRAVGYIDCGTFDCCTVYDGEGPDGPIITEPIDTATGSIAFVVAPELRRQGLGRATIIALLRRPELRAVQLFEAGVEPENAPPRRCLEAAGFQLGSAQPDYEGMLYYRADRRSEPPAGARPG
jgi:RimJ/RimL family protein N-acetyltransferase